MTKAEALQMLDRQLARAKAEKAKSADEEQAIKAENRKTILSPEGLKALAQAIRHQPGFGSPYWFQGRWVWLSPHGDARSRCGSPVPPPEAVQPHQQLLWAKCRHCNSRTPWGGCGSKYARHTSRTWQ